MMTQPKCIRAAVGMNMLRKDVATMAKPNTLEEQTKGENRHIKRLSNRLGRTEWKHTCLRRIFDK